MASADTAILTGIRDHEIAHRDFFKAALKKNAIPALEVDFTKIDFNSRDSVPKTAMTFEDLGVAAYNGAGHLLEKPRFMSDNSRVPSGPPSPWIHPLIETRTGRDELASGTN
jgi:hypothetical protein